MDDRAIGLSAIGERGGKLVAERGQVNLVWQLCWWVASLMRHDRWGRGLHRIVGVQDLTPLLAASHPTVASIEVVQNLAVHLRRRDRPVPTHRLADRGDELAQRDVLIVHVAEHE